MRSIGGLALVGSLALGAALLGGTIPLEATTRAASTPTWVTTNGKVVDLTIIAAWNNENVGYNFNGAAHGQMVITVPLGDTVNATFKNNGQGAPHDVVVIPYTMPLPGNGMQPAFPGAASPRPQFRPGSRPSGGVAQKFSFVASKAGNYMLICGIAGHALAGMWDTLVVSPTATTASVTFNKAGVTSTVPPAQPPATTSNWISTAGKIVHLTLISGYNNTNAGFNFNGGAYGQMVVTVPLGATVDATYSNAVPVFHDVDIIAYQKPLPSHSATPAFTGSRSPLPSFRPGAGGPPPTSSKPVTFSFVADKAGTYMIICGVPGHALAGMWDTFVVSPSATTASITFTS